MDIVNLGKLIKTLRKEKEMTQENLASRLGVTISAISKWETGKNSPDIAMLQTLSEVLEISLEELYTPEEALLSRSSKSLSTKVTNMTASTLAEDTSETDTDTSESSKVTQVKSTKGFCKYRGILLAIGVLLGITLICTTGYLIKVKNEKLNIRPYAYRIAEDEQCGEVYEAACLYSGNLETLTHDDPYIAQLSTAWKSNEYVEETIIIMKVSFYSNEEQASNWSTPQKVIYLVR